METSSRESAAEESQSEVRIKTVRPRSSQPKEVIQVVFNRPISNPSIWFESKVQDHGIDIDLYATYDGRTPATDDYDRASRLPGVDDDLIVPSDDAKGVETLRVMVDDYEDSTIDNTDYIYKYNLIIEQGDKSKNFEGHLLGTGDTDEHFEFVPPPDSDGSKITVRIENLRLEEREQEGSEEDSRQDSKEKKSLDIRERGDGELKARNTDFRVLGKVPDLDAGEYDIIFEGENSSGRYEGGFEITRQ